MADMNIGIGLTGADNVVGGLTQIADSYEKVADAQKKASGGTLVAPSTAPQITSESGNTPHVIIDNGALNVNLINTDYLGDIAQSTASILSQIQAIANKAPNTNADRSGGLVNTVIGNEKLVKDGEAVSSTLTSDERPSVEQEQASNTNTMQREASPLESLLNETRQQTKLLSDILKLRESDEQKKKFDEVEGKGAAGGVKKLVGMKGLDYALQGASLIEQGFATYYQTDASATKQALEGDFLGSKQTRWSGAMQTASSATGGVGNMALGAGALLGATPIGIALMGIGGLAKLTSLVLGGIEAEKKGDYEKRSAYGNVYKERLPAIEDFFRAYANEDTTYTNETGWEEEKGKKQFDITKDSEGSDNAQRALTLFETYADRAKGTGLSEADFISLASTFSKYGVSDTFKTYVDTKGTEDTKDDEVLTYTDETGAPIIAKAGADTATAMARDVANISRYTGVDNNTLATFAGTQFRYNGEDTTASLGNILLGAKEQGLNKTQTGEFLSAMQRVVQKGIEQGYKTSTAEVADTLAFLAKKSDNSEFWRGEQGANRYMQIASGISNSTQLANSTQMLTFNAFDRVAKKLGEGGLKNELGNTYVKGGGFLNTFALMEKNPTGETLTAVNDSLKRAYGDDKIGNIFAIKELTGLNYTGAMQYYNLMSGEGKYKGLTTAERDEELKKITTNTQYQSDSTRQMDAVSKIQDVVTHEGKTFFDNNISAKDDIIEAMKTEADRLLKDKRMEQYDKLIKGAEGIGNTKTTIKVRGGTKETRVVGALDSKYGHDKYYASRRIKDYLGDGKLDKDELGEMISKGITFEDVLINCHYVCHSVKSD